MAERRMFAKAIIHSARFLRMPPSSRLLYYDLGMSADDDGIVEAFTVMRVNGATEDDLRVLATKGFIKILNGDLVTLILDWKKNNLIQKDRYHPSIYANLLVQISDGNTMEPEREQTVTNLVPQVRLGKVSIESEGSKRKRFSPPTLEEIQGFMTGYAKDKGLCVDVSREAESFMDYFASNGWKVGGKAPMRDWEATARRWIRNARGIEPARRSLPEVSSATTVQDLYGS